MDTTSRDYAEKLVSEVQKRPQLYDPKNPAYKDRYLVEIGWREVAEAVDSTVEAAKRRWQNLRGSFTKSLTAVKTTPGGSAAKKTKSFYLASQMEFLKDHLSHGPTKGNYGSTSSALKIEIDEAESEEETEENLTINTTSTEDIQVDPMQSPSASDESPASIQPRTKRKANWEDAAAAFLERKMARMEEQQQPCEALEFFKGLLPQIKKLSGKRQREFFMGLSQLLFAKIDEQEEEEASASKSSGITISFV